MYGSDRYRAFRCPLCDSDGYAPVTVRKPNGDFYRTEFYSCASCSVMFIDPKDFTDQRKRVSDGIATGLPAVPNRSEGVTRRALL